MALCETWDQEKQGLNLHPCTRKPAQFLRPIYTHLDRIGQHTARFAPPPGQNQLSARRSQNRAFRMASGKEKCDSGRSTPRFPTSTRVRPPPCRSTSSWHHKRSDSRRTLHQHPVGQRRKRRDLYLPHHVPHLLTLSRMRQNTGHFRT